MDDVEGSKLAQGPPQSNRGKCVMEADAAIHRQEPDMQARAESVDGVGEMRVGADGRIYQRNVMTRRDLVAEKLHNHPAASSAGGFDDMANPHPASV